MQIHTTARHCELDPEVRLFALQRLEKFGKFARDIDEVHVIVTAEGYRHSAEITLKLKRHEMVSREESDEPKLAIDLAASRLEQQLRRLKERRIDKMRGRGEVNGKLPAMEPAGEPDEFLGEEE